MDAAQRLEFAPPPGAGLSRALLLALLAHVLLVTALTWGVRWKRDAAQVTAEAELWSSVPLAAAPRLVETPPAPAAEPPAPQPAPQPVTQPVTQPVAPPLASKADIALEREKQRQKTERQQAALKLEQQRRQQAALDKKREQEQQAALEKKKKAEQSTKVADAAKSKQEAEQAKQEAAKLETQRQLNMQRMAGLAGASGAPSATGSARQSAAPSAGYAARVVASIKPNVVFTEEPVGNPSVDIELRTAADGTIVSSKVIKSSGNKAWDDAVQKGIDKTAVLPRDLDGRVPSPMVIAYRFR